MSRDPVPDLLLIFECSFSVFNWKLIVHIKRSIRGELGEMVLKGRKIVFIGSDCELLINSNSVKRAAKDGWWNERSMFGDLMRPTVIFILSLERFFCFFFFSIKSRRLYFNNFDLILLLIFLWNGVNVRWTGKVILSYVNCDPRNKEIVIYLPLID